MRRTITTAIDYPNAAPHMGHVLEKVLADVLARWFRMCGDAVRFQIGTDEHGIKMQRAAADAGLAPQEFVDRNVVLFQDLYRRLQVSYDVFVRTSDRAVHWPTVEALWRRLRDAGVLEKRSYTGLYCSGCERFMTVRDLEDGLCPNHRRAPEEVTEENWFLRMHAFTRELGLLLTDAWDGESYRIIPAFRAKETLSLIEQGLEDVSFSRPISSLTWGIPVPDDADQIMYVWCDALTNYISTLGYCTDHEDASWWDDARVTHVIGKDIARFHALIWPLMLKKAGIRIPDELLIHGFLTSEGQKMSKSLGNVVVPEDVLDRFEGNPDPLRFYLAHEVPVGNDGDFSWKRLEELYDSKLRNQLGNLLNRILVLLRKEGGALAVPAFSADTLGDADALSPAEWWQAYAAHMDRYEVHKAVEIVGRLVMTGNACMDTQKPWTLAGEEKRAALSSLAELLRHISLLLLPIMPGTAAAIARQLGVPYAERMTERDCIVESDWRTWGGGEKLAKQWKTVGEPSILFPPLSS